MRKYVNKMQRTWEYNKQHVSYYFGMYPQHQLHCTKMYQSANRHWHFFSFQIFRISGKEHAFRTPELKTFSHVNVDANLHKKKTGNGMCKWNKIEWLKEMRLSEKKMSERRKRFSSLGMARRRLKWMDFYVKVKEWQWHFLFSVGVLILHVEFASCPCPLSTKFGRKKY